MVSPGQKKKKKKYERITASYNLPIQKGNLHVGGERVKKKKKEKGLLHTVYVKMRVRT